MCKNRNMEKKKSSRNVQISSILTKMLPFTVENTVALITAQIYESLKTVRNRTSINKQIIQACISDYGIIEKRSCIRYYPQI